MDERHVANGISADNDRVEKLAAGETAFHRWSAGGRHVKIGERKTVGRNQHARSAAFAFAVEDGDRGLAGALHGCNTPILCFDHCPIRCATNLLGMKSRRDECCTCQDGSNHFVTFASTK